MRRLIAMATSVVVLVAVAGCSVRVDSVPAVAIAKAQLSIEGAWVRTTTGAKDKSMTAGFMSIVNPGEGNVVLTSAECADAGVVRLQEMVMQAGKMGMQETRDGIAVPAGGRTHLTSGGYHIMLMMLKRELAVGDEVEVTLHFSDGGTLQVTAPVREAVEEEDEYHSPVPAATASS